jgi:hypothetical protein
MLALATLAWLAAAEVSTTGYLDTRATFQRLEPAPLTPGASQPRLVDLLEANLQLKIGLGPRGFVGADVSLFWQWAGLYQDGQGRDVPAYRPLVAVSELYATYELTPHLNLTVGKKRVVWGPGLAQNPTDLLDPPKDPTDPTAQRAGSWLVRAELPHDRYTLSFVGAAQVLRQYAGLPANLLVYPGFPSAEAARGWTADDRDGRAHFALAARAYALIADTDLNVIYAFTNLYNESIADRHRVGLTASHVFGGWEVHGEALLQTGTSRAPLDPGCEGAGLADCLSSGALARPLTTGLRPRALLGARYLFADNAMLSLEYSYHGPGLAAADFERYVRVLAAAGRDPTLAAALAGTSAPLADPGSPQRYSFDPLRRHYLLVSYSKPQIRNDFTVGAVLLLGLEDLSGQLNPSVTWSLREWLSLNLAAYLTIPSPPGMGASLGGERRGELELGSSRWRLVGSVRAFF